MAATVLGRSVGTRYTTQITTAHHQVIADEPAPEGDDLGPTPYELLLSAPGCVYLDDAPDVRAAEELAAAGRARRADP